MVKVKSFVVGLGVGLVGVAAAMTLPNTFTSGTPISSSAVNANFAAVKTAVDAVETSSAQAQARVTGTCTSPQTVTGINADGTVACGGSPRAWAVVYSNGELGSQGGATWTITHISTGHYCFATTPNFLGTYDPVLATLHGYQPGSIVVNTEYGDTCNSISRGHAVLTFDSSGNPADRYFVISIL